MRFPSTCRIVAPLLLALLPGLATAACVPVIGTVKLLPDAACAIRGAAQPGVPPTTFTGDCFSVHLALAGFPAGNGYAGTTVEPLVSMVPGAPATVTPAMVPVSPAVPAPRQIVQTARTALKVGQSAHATTLYTTDVIVIQPQLSSTGATVPGAVVEQILIAGTDGKGAYAKATGNLAVVGNSIGRPAPVAGQICLP